MKNKYYVGVRSGFYNLTWPLATCYFDTDTFVINSIFGTIGNIPFITITKVERYDGVFSKGLKVIYLARDRERVIIIRINARREELFRQLIIKIQEMKDLHREKDIINEKNQFDYDIDLSGYPFRNWFIVTFLIFWNVPLFILHFSIYEQLFTKDEKACYSILHSCITELIFLIMLFSKSFQKLFLKHGRNIDEIRRLLIIAIIILGLLSLNSYSLHFSRY